MASKKSRAIEPIVGDNSGELLPRIAREHLTSELTKKKRPEAETSEFLSEKHGVIVTLRTLDGELRGQAGIVKPEAENLIEETRAQVMEAARNDVQHPPLKKTELKKIRIEVTVITPPEEVGSIIELDPEIYGVVLTARKTGRQGLMLPGEKGLNTVDKQLAAIRRRMGFRPDEPFRIGRFRSATFVEKTEA
ncbi:MAG: AMMECR1 domain-containing protein [Verrucomicrobiae bacterium]|nr:AMMECR1 domain-containing protein [Verrucomicrobiae bacterium]MCP5541634.1 AMMECR1 domain-containing protein [Akkermansiaceae bacterium]